jgi:hypothetical protein
MTPFQPVRKARHSPPTRLAGGPWMTRIEKIIVVVLGVLSLSFLGYIISSWTSQRTTAAPRPEVAATVTPPLQNAVSPPPPVPAPQAQPSAATQSRPDYFLRAKQAISEGMRDPDSVKFGKLFEGTGLSGNQTICGEVNAKNGFGGYTGMTPFIYFIDTNLATTVEFDPRRIKQITDVGTLNRMLIGLKAYRVECGSPVQ